MERARHRTSEGTPTVVLSVPRPRTPPDNTIGDLARTYARRGRRRRPRRLWSHADIQRLAPLLAVAGVMVIIMVVTVAVMALE
jgi:hypothetical protein